MKIPPLFIRFLTRVRALVRADLRDRVAQDSFVVLLGHLVRLSLGIISSAVLARGLGPEGLSAFAIVGATTAILATVADFGLRLSAVRYIADDKRQKARAIAGAYTRWKLLGGILLTAVLLLGASPLARLLQFPAEGGPVLLRLGAIVMLVTVLNGMVSTVLHARSRFAALALTQVVNVALTVLLMAMLWLTGRLTVGTALVVGGVTAAAAGLLGYAMLPAPWRSALRHPVSLVSSESRRLLSFSRWLWASNIFSIAAVQVDVLLLNFWLPPALVGIYALARNLAFKADILNQTLHVVLVPNVSALTDKQGYRTYIRRALARSLLLVGLLLLLTPLVRPFILTVYGAQFREASNVFYALMAVILLDLVASPLVLLALPLNRPRLLAAADGVQLFLLVAVGLVAVPAMGVYGIVVAKFVARVAGIAATLAPISRQLRRPEELNDHPHSVVKQDIDTVPTSVPPDPT